MKANNKSKDLIEDREHQVKAKGPCPTDQEDNTENKDKSEVKFEY